MMSQNIIMYLLSSDQSDSSLPFSCSDIASGPRKLTYDTRLSLGACVEGVVWGKTRLIGVSLSEPQTGQMVSP